MNTKYDAINEAFRIAKSNGIAGYAIECIGGVWVASDRKPMLRYGKVIECQVNGKEVVA